MALPGPACGGSGDLFRLGDDDTWTSPPPENDDADRAASGKGLSVFVTFELDDEEDEEEDTGVERASLVL